MTEEEWLACGDPKTMVTWLSGRITPRKNRLLLLACCRTYPEVELVELNPALAAAERHIEGVMSSDEASWWAEETNRLKTRQVEEQDFEKAALARTVQYIFEEPGVAFPGYLYWHNEYPWPKLKEESDRISCCFIREVLNPFSSPLVEPSWLTSDVLALTCGIYEERAFDRMPILADALQDAGCTNEDVFSHCRDANQTHARGCWIVDLLLGKE